MRRFLLWCRRQRGYSLDHVRLAIIHEDVIGSIGIVGDEVAGGRGERYVAAVGAHTMPTRFVVSLRAVVGDVHAFDTRNAPHRRRLPPARAAGPRPRCRCLRPSRRNCSCRRQPWSWRFRRCRVGRCRRHRGRRSSRSGPTRRCSSTPSALRSLNTVPEIVANIWRSSNRSACRRRWRSRACLRVREPRQ